LILLSTMANEPFYKDHWIKIDQDRLDRYDRMFQWNRLKTVPPW